MKKTLLVLSLVLLTLGTLLLSACNAVEKEPENATEGLEYILNSSGKSYTLSGIGNATDKDIVIASKYNGIAVTEIAPDAFSGCTEITSVVIPRGVRIIGESAFANCTSLKEIEIPNTLATIGAGAFYQCTSLEEIEIPSKVTAIGALAFYNCKSLETVDMNGNMVAIGDKTFYGCEKLTSILFPKTVTSVGASVLEGCTSLKSLTAPFIGASKDGGANAHLGYLFGSSNNSAVPTSLRTVRLTNANNVGAGAFKDCKSLISVTLDNGISIIGVSAFKGCTGLTSLVIPGSVTNIGSKAFEGCSKLQSITLPFVGASKEEARNYYLGYVFGASNYQENAECVPATLKEVEITDAKIIKANAFYGCSGITSIIIDSGVETIGSGAFTGCTSLEEMVLPFIGATKDDKNNNFFGYIFGGANSSQNEAVVPATLKKVEITKIEKIAAYAFAGCVSLEEIVIDHESVKSIGKFAFVDTKYFDNEENWEDGILYIGTILVAAKEDLSGACTIKDGTTYIAKSAFEGCEGITSVYVPQSVNYIDEQAFKGCTALAEATFANAVNGWKAGSTPLTVTDTAENAKYLRETYINIHIHFSIG